MIFKAFDDEIKEHSNDVPWINRNDNKPSQQDFVNNRIFTPQYFYDAAIKDIESSKYPVIIGAPDSGKTWLAYSLGYYFSKKENTVVKYGIIGDDFSNDDAIDEINSVSRRLTRYIFILDDLHENPDEAKKFIEEIIERELKGVSFIFTTRKTGNNILSDTINGDQHFSSDMVALHLLQGKEGAAASKGQIRNIINYVINTKGFNYALEESELDEIVNKWGNNLFWISVCLKSWESSEQKISDISKQDIIESIWTAKGEIKLCQRKKIFFILATICQFSNLRVYGGYEGFNKNNGMICEISNQGLIEKSNVFGLDYYSINPSMASLILEVFREKEIRYQEICEQKQVHLINNYMETNPPNWQSVFITLIINKNSKDLQKNELAEKILLLLTSNPKIQSLLKENIHLISLNTFGQIYRCFPENNLNYLDEIKKIYFSDLDSLRSDIKKRSARIFNSDILVLKDHVDLNVFFSDFTVEDYKKVVEKSSFDSIVYLMYGMQKFKLDSEINKISRAVINSDINSLIQNYPKDEQMLRKRIMKMKKIMDANKIDGELFTELCSKLDEDSHFVLNKLGFVTE